MSKVDLRDIVKGTPEAEAAMHRAMVQAQADMEAVHQRASSCYQQSIDKTADQITTILVDLWNMVDIEDVEEQLIDVGAIADAREATQALITQAKKDLLAEVMEKVIGENETYEGHTMNWAIEHHNALRQQQRAAIKEIEEKLSAARTQKRSEGA